jgi:hypothetical protein
MIPLNPTLFAEYKLGVGKDYERQKDEDDPVPHIPDAFEVRLLLGEQFGRRFQWAFNLFHEQQLGGEREWENGFSQTLTYAIRDEYLKTGIEMQFIRRTDEESCAHPTYEFTIGLNFTWKPSPRTRLDLAALFGTTPDSPRAKSFAVFSFFFGVGHEDTEAAAPVPRQFGGGLCHLKPCLYTTYAMDISRHDGLLHTASPSFLRAVGHTSSFAHEGFMIPRYISDPERCSQSDFSPPSCASLGHRERMGIA